MDDFNTGQFPYSSSIHPHGGIIATSSAIDPTMYHQLCQMQVSPPPTVEANYSVNQWQPYTWQSYPLYQPNIGFGCIPQSFYNTGPMNQAPAYLMAHYFDSHIQCMFQPQTQFQDQTMQDFTV